MENLPGRFSECLERRLRTSQHDPLHLIERHLIARSVVELRRPRTLMRRDRLGLFQRPAVLQIGRDPRRPEGVAADRLGDPGVPRPALHQVERIPHLEPAVR